MKRETKLLKTKCRNDMNILLYMSLSVTSYDLKHPTALRAKLNEIRTKTDCIMQDWQTLYNCQLRYGATAAQMRYYEIIRDRCDRLYNDIDKYEHFNKYAIELEVKE